MYISFSSRHVRKKVKMSTLLKRAGPGTIFGILTGLKDAREWCLCRFARIRVFFNISGVCKNHPQGLILDILKKFKKHFKKHS